jgi:hypothetical protein
MKEKTQEHINVAKLMQFDTTEGLSYESETYDNLITFLHQDAQINRELATIVARCNTKEDLIIKLLASFIPVYNELLKQKENLDNK